MKRLLEHTISFILGILTGLGIVFLFKEYFCAVLIYLILSS